MHFYLAIVKRLGESDFRIILEEVWIALDALRNGWGGGVWHCVVEEPVEVNVVHTLKTDDMAILKYFHNFLVKFGNSWIRHQAESGPWHGLKSWEHGRTQGRARGANLILTLGQVLTWKKNTNDKIFSGSQLKY